MQDVFVKLYHLSQSFDNDAHLRNWLIRATLNRSKDYLRSPCRRLNSPIEAAREALSEPYDTDCTVFDAVMALPQKYREVVILYYYEEYSTAEIGALLHRKVTTVQTQLMRAKAQLKETLQEVWENESDSTQLSNTGTIRKL